MWNEATTKVAVKEVLQGDQGDVRAFHTGMFLGWCRVSVLYKFLRVSGNCGIRCRTASMQRKKTHWQGQPLHKSRQKKYTIWNTEKAFTTINHYNTQIGGSYLKQLSISYLSISLHFTLHVILLTISKFIWNWQKGCIFFLCKYTFKWFYYINWTVFYKVNFMYTVQSIKCTCLYFECSLNL